MVASKRRSAKAKAAPLRKARPKKADAAAAHRFVDPVSLSLDTKNPRFAAYGGHRKEKDVIRYLLDHADLRELVESIAANGYVDFEPLVVIDEDASGKLTVIEGNRRVAAIKLLRNNDLAVSFQVTLPPVRSDLEPTLKRAKILEVPTREAARQYIGFKHINGPHKWDAFAKGKFAADWYRAERASGTTIHDIANRLGDRHDTILRLVNGIYVLEQAKRLKLFEIEDRALNRPFFFSHLYTALTRTPYREYLGLDLEWRQAEPIPDPVPVTHREKLKQVLIWIYGSASDEIEPLVKSQNPHIKELGEVLAHPVALKRLEATDDLKKAHAEVTTRGKKFEESLVKAVKHGEEAQQNVDAYDGDPTLIEFGDRLAKIGRGLVQSMKAATANGDESA